MTGHITFGSPLKKTFRQYLEEKFWKQYEGLDDESVEAQDNWLEELDIDLVIAWAEEWRAYNDKL